MAVDSPLEKKRGRPAGAAGSPSAKRGRPAGVGSPSAKSKMEQKMKLVHQRLALLDRESDKDADVAAAATSDEKLAIAIVVDKQPTAINCDDTNDEEEHVPLKVVPPGRVHSEQKKLPGVPQTHNNQNTYTAKKKRGRPAGSKSSKSKIGQKLTSVKPRLALIESGISNSSKNDMDDDPVPMKKRGRPAGSKSFKSKMGQKLTSVKPRPALIESGISNSSKNDMDVDPVPVKKRGRPAGSKSSKSKMGQKLTSVRPRPALIESGISNSSKNDMGADPVPMKKRGRPAGSKSSKSKMGQKLTTVKPRRALIESGSSNSSKNDMDNDPVPMVSDVNGQKTRASYSVKGSCGSTMERAKEVQGKLSAEHPSFVREMLHSHVVKGFWVGLPSDFCNKHLPKEDTTFVLEDEDGHICETKYQGTRQAFSAGWRGFATDHGIKVGDVAVFQLVSSATFKVYILRANNFTTPDGALGLLCLEACKEKNTSNEAICEDAKSKEDLKITKVSSKAAQSDSSNLGGECIDGISFSAACIDFGDVGSFSDFNITVDGSVIDREFSDHLRKTYYELCCSQKSFLHKNLLKQINLPLAVGVIMETINITEGIRACKAHACSHEDFVTWKRTLESFELLGMNVGFLLKRIGDLLGLSAQSIDPVECEKYKEMKLEQARGEEKMKELDSEMSTVKDALKKIDVEMEEMESSMKRRGEMLLQIAAAPW